MLLLYHYKRLRLDSYAYARGELYPYMF